MGGEIGLGVEMHFAEEGYWRYYINQYGVREGFSEAKGEGRGKEGVMMKKTTVIIIEVEDFVMRLRVKAKSVNDSEYMGVFLEREVRVFTKEMAQALLF